MFHKEIDTIFHILKNNLPNNTWDGKECIKEMQKNNYKHWKQMESPGFYFQFKCETILSQNQLMQIPVLNSITLNLTGSTAFLGILKHTASTLIKPIMKEYLQTVITKQ